MNEAISNNQKNDEFIIFFQRFVIEYSKLYEVIISTVLSVNVVVICAVLLMIQIKIVSIAFDFFFVFVSFFKSSGKRNIYFCQSQNLGNPIDLAILSIQVFGAFFFLLVTCEFGGRITTAHDEIDSVMLQSSWYRFPVEVKKILPTVILIVQKEIALHGIGSVVCSRESFQRVCYLLKQKCNYL